ncbi:helix-turn-helix transcriptional regulator [Novosphingobium indicum]|uniref:helix-turn-helix transcriptional regulator n=1 Tax=Novosphingobium indicum TaxID=462949 RepID=UPI00166B52D3
MTNTATTNDEEYAAFNINRSNEDRLLTTKEVCSMISLGRTWLWSAVRNGKFPQPVSVGSRTFWKLSSVRGWISAL